VAANPSIEPTHKKLRLLRLMSNVRPHDLLQNLYHLSVTMSNFLRAGTSEIMGIPKPPKECPVCDKQYFKEECVVRFGELFKLYCCPRHEDVVIYKELNL
jgi:hypothetical protein